MPAEDSHSSEAPAEPRSTFEVAGSSKERITELFACIHRNDVKRLRGICENELGLRTPEDWKDTIDSGAAQLYAAQAAKKGHIDILHYLVGEMKVPVCKLGENVAEVSSRLGNDCLPRDKAVNPVLAAVYADQEQCLDYLLQHLREGEVDSQGEHGLTLLHYAATLGYLQLVARLVNKHEAKVDILAHSGHTGTHSLPHNHTPHHIHKYTQIT
jgi:hypothetical protein